MITEVLILTKSRKHSNYCIAGINAWNGEWIRLEDENETCFLKETFMYPNGRTPRILETAIVDLGAKCGTTLQPENYKVKTILGKGKACSRDIFYNRLKKDKDEHYHIFYDYSRKIEDGALKKYDREKYSLMLIEPEEFYVCRNINMVGKIQYKAQIKYNGIIYSDLIITDIKYEEYLQKFDCLKTSPRYFRVQDQVYLVVSLGETFHNPNNCKDEHYKLVASVITEKEIKKELIE